MAKRRDRDYAVITRASIRSPDANADYGTPPARTAGSPNSSPTSSPPTNASGGSRAVGPTLAAYLTRKWLPMKQVTLPPSTWDSYAATSSCTS